MASSVMDNASPTYCEASTGWLLEPINTLTNIGFFITAWLLWRHYKRTGDGALPNDIRLLVLLIVGVGFGSTAWHATQEGWGLFLDSLFIQLFMLTYLVSYLRRYTEWSLPARIASMVLFMGACIASPSLWPWDFAHASAGYIPALLLLCVFALHQHRILRFKAAGYLGIATGVFALSLSLRTADTEVCAYIPMGLHFMWHILNAIVLYYSVRGLFKR